MTSTENGHDLSENMGGQGCRHTPRKPIPASTGTSCVAQGSRRSPPSERDIRSPEAFEIMRRVSMTGVVPLTLSRPLRKLRDAPSAAPQPTRLAQQPRRSSGSGSSDSIRLYSIPVPSELSGCSANQDHGQRTPPTLLREDVTLRDRQIEVSGGNGANAIRRLEADSSIGLPRPRNALTGSWTRSWP